MKNTIRRGRDQAATNAPLWLENTDRILVVPALGGRWLAWTLDKPRRAIVFNRPGILYGAKALADMMEGPSAVWIIDARGERDEGISPKQFDLWVLAKALFHATSVLIVSQPATLGYSAYCAKRVSDEGHSLVITTTESKAKSWEDFVIGHTIRHRRGNMHMDLHVRNYYREDSQDRGAHDERAAASRSLVR